MPMQIKTTPMFLSVDFFSSKKIIPKIYINIIFILVMEYA